MRSFVLDEISDSDITKIREYLSENTLSSSLENVFWINIPEDILSDLQNKHIDCQPHVFAVELGNDWVKFEFLIRSSKGMSCTCQAFATEKQVNFIHKTVDSIIDDLNITT